MRSSLVFSPENRGIITADRSLQSGCGHCISSLLAATIIFPWSSTQRVARVIIDCPGRWWPAPPPTWASILWSSVRATASTLLFSLITSATLRADSRVSP